MGKTKINQKQTNITVPNPLLFENEVVEDNGGNVFTIDNQKVPTHHYLEYTERRGGYIELHLNQVDDFVLCSICVWNTARGYIEFQCVSDTAIDNEYNPLYTIDIRENERTCIMYMKIKGGIFIWPGATN
jgi:hypothetical protein